MKPRRIQYGKFGLKENPIGYQVAVSVNGRQYLGDVMAVRYDQVRGSVVLSVRHFNGEMWPFEPMALAVEVL